MLAQGLGLKVSFLWFQRLESNGRELQKSNASLEMKGQELVAHAEETIRRAPKARATVKSAKENIGR